MVRDDYASNFVVPPLKDIVTEPYFRKERNRPRYPVWDQAADHNKGIG